MVSATSPLIELLLLITFCYSCNLWFLIVLIYGAVNVIQIVAEHLVLSYDIPPNSFEVRDNKIILGKELCAMNRGRWTSRHDSIILHISNGYHMNLAIQRDIKE